MGSGPFLRPSALDEADGFIHFCALSQLYETLKRHFSGVSGLVCLRFPVHNLTTAPAPARLIWEPSHQGDLFPHFYGMLLAEWSDLRYLVPSSEAQRRQLVAQMKMTDTSVME